MMIAGILDPYRYDFFTNGILVATIAGALCGLLGVYVVLRGLSYIGHGLSHSVFGALRRFFLAACWALRRLTSSQCL